MSKGQIFSYDVVFASAIFLGILLMASVFWSNTNAKISYWENYKWMDEAAKEASDQLLLSPGNPTDWYASDDIISIGLIENRNEISQEKLIRFAALNSTNYTEIKELLGVVQYDLFVQISYFNGTVVSEFGKVPSEENEAISRERMALLSGKDVKVLVRVWK